VKPCKAAEMLQAIREAAAEAKAGVRQ